MVQGTPRGYTIFLGGPPLFHQELGLHNELCGKDEIKQDPNADPTSNWNLLLPTKRDGLLGACLRGHVASIPLYTDSDLDRPTCHLQLRFHFALSMPKIKNLPLLDIETASDPRFYEPWAPKAEEIDGQFADWNIAIIDGIVYPASCLDVRKSFRYFHDRQYPSGYTRIECTLHKLHDCSELDSGLPDVGKSVDSQDEVILPVSPPCSGNSVATDKGDTEEPNNKRARK